MGDIARPVPLPERATAVAASPWPEPPPRPGRGAVGRVCIPRVLFSTPPYLGQVCGWAAANPRQQESVELDINFILGIPTPQKSMHYWDLNC